MSQSDTLIQLVQGTAAALAAQIEEALPELPWCEELRKVVTQDIEGEIGPSIAGVVERLVLAAL